MFCNVQIRVDPVVTLDWFVCPTISMVTTTRTAGLEKTLNSGLTLKAIYRVCGLAITAGIAVKFSTTHGRSRPAVGGAKCIGSYGRKGVPPAPCIFGTCQQKMKTPTEFFRPIYNFYSLTIYI